LSYAARDCGPPWHQQDRGGNPKWAIFPLISGAPILDAHDTLNLALVDKKLSVKSSKPQSLMGRWVARPR